MLRITQPKPPKKWRQKLQEFDIPAKTEQVFTTSMATADYIFERKQDARVYVIGEEGIRSALEEKGFQFAGENADFVVIGLDREVNYEKFASGLFSHSKWSCLHFD